MYNNDYCKVNQGATSMVSATTSRINENKYSRMKGNKQQVNN